MHVTELRYEQLSIQDKSKLGQAVTRFHTYIGGCPTHLGLPSTFSKCYKRYRKSKKEGGSGNLFKDKLGISKPDNYVTHLEKSFPCFLHSCFRYALVMVGNEASIEALSHYMNEKAKIENKAGET